MHESDNRVTTLAARLAKIGLADAGLTASRLSEFPDLLTHPELLDELALAADPNLALNALFDFVSSASDSVVADLLDDAGLRARFLIVTGASSALAEFLVKHPRSLAQLSSDSDWEQPATRKYLVEYLLNSVKARTLAGRPVAAEDSEMVINDMRVAYREKLLQIAARDLAAEIAFEQVSFELSALADAVLETANAIAWAGINPTNPASRLAVIAMGKSGGQELNYISDVDVIFVAAGNNEDSDYLAEATRVATRLMQICEMPSIEPAIWQVDPNLRPEGKAGALVRSLDGYLSYYSRWAETWEYQALLKARFAAGDAELGAEYVDAVLPFVWRAAARPNFVTDVQAMRQRVVSSIPAKERDRQLKLGVGGLRDVEFAVQLLQLVHGSADVMLRNPNTMQALEALANWGYVGREDAAAMAAVYRFERTLEHRIQLFQMRRTHLVPEGENDLRRIGRSMGFRTDPANELEKALKRIRQDARRLHEKLFYRPLLQAVARLDPIEARLSLDAAQERLSALGFVDSESALRHLAALSQGVSRRAAIQRTLLPVMLQWMAETPSPDAGLLAFRKLSDELGATPWYLRLLRDESAVAEHMAHLLSISRYFAALLMRTPEAVGMLADPDDLHPKTLTALSSEMLAVAVRQVDAESGVMAIRSIRQRELIRISAAQLIGVSDLRQTGNALSDLMDATVQSALEVVKNAHFANKPASLEISAIALGRWGGRELNFGSDADAMFVYRQITESAGSDALAIVSKLQQLLSQPAVDPPLELDLDLRPEGKNGPIARSIDSYKTYYERWSLTWESQALLRARAVGGSQVGFELIEFIDSLRYPTAGLSESDKREIRRIKARVEAERLPRGADPALHVKLGPGGISDVEWAVQFLQLQIAHLHPELQSTSTVESLNQLEEVGILDSVSKSALLEVWTLAGEIRNANTLALAKSSDSIPTNPQELRQIAYLLKFQNGAELVENYRKLSRRARKIMQEIVYGDSQN